MRIAFISDIHGNANALEAVLADIKKKYVDKIYVLGDICYRGPEPQRSLDLVRGLNTEVIKGNADEWVVRGVNKGEVPDSTLEIMNKERDWVCSQLDKESIDYLEALPTELKLEFEGFKIHAFHATPESLFEVVLPQECEDTLETKIMGEEANLYVYAHIHKPFIHYINGKVIMNIGSVGLPFDGISKPSYGLVDFEYGMGFQTSIIRVRYDTNTTVNQFEKSDYPNKNMMIDILRNGYL